MGSNHSAFLKVIDTASYDDTCMREYLIDFINSNSEIFEDIEDDFIPNERPYGPLRTLSMVISLGVTYNL